MHKFWDYLSHARYKIALKARLIIDVIILGVGIALSVLGGTSVLEIIGAASTLLGLILLATNLWAAWKDNQQTRIVENEEYIDLLKACRLPDGFKLEYGSPGFSAETRGIGAVDARPYATSEEVNRLLDGARNPISVEPGNFEVPPSLQAYRLRCINLKKPDRNDLKVGLRTDLTIDVLSRKQPIKVQRTDYFSGAATNELACEQFESVASARIGRPSLIFAVSDLVIHNNELLGLMESRLSNHIGVSTIVLTSDHQIVVQDQGAQTISGNETGVGASGSLDMKDITRTMLDDPTLQGLVRFGMEREAEEELSATFAVGRRNTVLTGYARYLARGGKPEFFGITRTSAALAALKPTRADRRYVSGIWGRPYVPTRDGLIKVLDQLLDEGINNRRRYSLSMVVSLRMARNYLDRNDLRF